MCDLQPPVCDLIKLTNKRISCLKKELCSIKKNVLINEEKINDINDIIKKSSLFVKKVSESDVKIGDNINYTIYVKNEGIVPICSFELVDVIPEGQASNITQITPDAVFNGSSIKWYYNKTLNIGEEVVFKFTTFSNKPGLFLNTSEIVKVNGDFVKNQNNGGTFVKVSGEQQICRDDISLGDQFGISVSLYNDRLLIGSPILEENPTLNNIGRVFIYELENGIWIEKQILISSSNNLLSKFLFGSQVYLDERKALIGDYYYPFIQNIDAGITGTTVSVFTLTNSEWQEEQELIPSDRQTVLNFGNSLSLNNNRALVGALNSVYIFEFDGNIWNEVKKIEFNNDTKFPEGRSISISLDNDRFTVGVNDYNPNSGSSQIPNLKNGIVYIYKLINNFWVEEKKIFSPISDGKTFGSSVSLEDNILIVGSPIYASQDVPNGYPYSFIYELKNNEWVEKQRLITNPPSQNLGFSSIINNKRIIIGTNNFISPPARDFFSFSYSFINNKYIEKKIEFPDRKELFAGLTNSSISLSNNRAVFGNYELISSNKKIVYIVDCLDPQPILTIKKFGPINQFNENKFKVNEQLNYKIVVQNNDNKVINNFILVDLLPFNQKNNVTDITSSGIYNNNSIIWNYNKSLNVGEETCFEFTTFSELPGIEINRSLIEKINDINISNYLESIFEIEILPSLDLEVSSISEIELNQEFMYKIIVKNNNSYTINNFILESFSEDILITESDPDGKITTEFDLDGNIVKSSVKWNYNMFFNIGDEICFTVKAKYLKCGNKSIETNILNIDNLSLGSKYYIKKINNIKVKNSDFSFTTFLSPGNSPGNLIGNFGKTISIDRLTGNRIITTLSETFFEEVLLYNYNENSGEWNRGFLSKKDISGFGFSLSLYGDVAVIGSPEENNGGACYIFRLINDLWQQEQIITPTPQKPNNKFGYSVSLYEDKIIVGSPEDSLNNGSGCCYYFKFENGSWTQKEILSPNSNSTNKDFFGRSLQLYNNSLIIGSPEENPNSNNGSGCCYIFKLENKWNQEQVLSIPQNESGCFGYSVSLYENKIAIGSIGKNSGDGAIYPYIFNNTSWEAKSKITDTNSNFGTSVSLTNNNLFVGSPISAPFNSGKLFIYVYNNSDWEFLKFETNLSSPTTFASTVDSFESKVITNSNDNISQTISVFGC